MRTPLSGKQPVDPVMAARSKAAASMAGSTDEPVSNTAGTIGSLAGLVFGLTPWGAAVGGPAVTAGLGGALGRGIGSAIDGDPNQAAQAGIGAATALSGMGDKADPAAEAAKGAAEAAPGAAPVEDVVDPKKVTGLLQPKRILA